MYVNGQKVILPQVEASGGKGIIYAIESFMMPPEGDVMQTLKMHDGHSTLVTALELTGLDAVLKEGRCEKYKIYIG